MTHDQHDERFNNEDQRYILLDTAVELVGRYVSHNPVPASQLPAIIAEVHQALIDRMQTAPVEVAAAPRQPAVPVKKSVTEEAITCLECGKNFKSMKRHIGTEHGQTPAEYRAAWSLPKDYPMVAPAYAQARSKLALELGLGRISPNKKRLAA